MIKAIIFDCFGVVLTDGLRENYEFFGGNFEKDLPFIVSIMHEASTGRIESSVPGMAKKLSISEAEWRKRNDDGHHINYELLGYIKELRENYQVAMLSNIGKGGVGRYFKAGFLEKYFEVIVESGVIGYAKPEAQAYEITADRLGVRLDECVFTDDRPEYIDGATGVGMKTILYKNLEQFKKDLEAILA
ncbi:MAG: HAD-IA family hydrolase [bacterium]|nr:HAD-IA family hydrolase [bacterium]